MPITIKNNVLLGTLRQHLSGRVRSAVNFAFNKDCSTIMVQSSNDYVFDTLINGSFTEDMIGESFTVLINNAIYLMQDDEQGLTSIVKSGDRVIFEQTNISIPFSIAYDERVDIPLSELQVCGTVGVKDIVGISRNFKRLLNISKALEKGVPSVIVASGRSFCLYSNTMLIDNAPVALPDIEIPYNTFSNLVKNLTGSSINVYVDSSKKILALQTGVKSVAMTTYKSPNLETIQAIDKRIGELKSIGTFKLGSLKTMELVYKCFNKETITMSFYKDYTVGFILSVSDGKTIRAGAKDIETIDNIVISTAQLDAFYKEFNSFSKIDVLVGNDVMCFKSINGTCLLLSGMTF